MNINEFLINLASIIFLGCFISSFSIFFLRISFAKKLNSTFVYIEEEMKKIENQILEKEYELFCTKVKKRIFLSRILLFTSLVILFGAMLTKDL